MKPLVPLLILIVIWFCIMGSLFLKKKSQDDCVTYHNDLNSQTIERNNCTQYFIISSGDTLEVVWKQRWSWSLKK